MTSEGQDNFDTTAPIDVPTHLFDGTWLKLFFIRSFSECGYQSVAIFTRIGDSDWLTRARQWPNPPSTNLSWCPQPDLLARTVIPAEQHPQPQQALYDRFLSVVGRALGWKRTTIYWVLMTFGFFTTLAAKIPPKWDSYIDLNSSRTGAFS